MDDDDGGAGPMEVEIPVHAPPAVGAAAAAAAEAAADALHLINDPTMLITPAERAWALEIKAAVEDPTSNSDNDELEAMCDFDYAQYAIITKGNLQEALRRITTIQAFRKNYKITNTVDQAVFYINALMDQQPGFVLNLNVDLTRQESVNCYDVGCFHPKVAMGITTSTNNSTTRNTRTSSEDQTTIIPYDNWQVCLGGVYYLKYSCQPTMSVIRNGFMELIDFGDYEWENFSLEAQERLFGELLSDYPMFEKHLLAYNTGYIANIAFGLAKSILPETMRNSIHLGCQIIEPEESRSPTRRLRDFYLQPTPEVAQKNLLERARLLVALRLHNEQVFRL